MAAFSPQDSWAQVAEVVRLVRAGEAQTRPELSDATRLGRNLITIRVQSAQDLGLLRPSGTMRSRGGRAADVWEFNGEAGHVLIALQGMTDFVVALVDLGLQVIERRQVAWKNSTAPELTCERMAAEMEAVIAKYPGRPVWGLGVGVLAPVDFDSGRSTDPVTSAAAGPRWPRSFDVRRWFINRLELPVWVDSVANFATLGTTAAEGAPDDLIFVRMGPGVGSGIVSDGKLHRGADWIAGEITHVTVQPDADRICVCGRLGCLESFASEQSIEADARRSAAQWRSPRLTAMNPDEVRAADIIEAAEAGDVACVEVVFRAADALGRVLAALVTWFNPRRIVVGGNRLATSPLFHSAMRRTLNAHALPASIANLEIRLGDPDRAEDVLGGTLMVREALLSPTWMVEWAPLGSPLSAPALVRSATQT